MHCQWSRDPDIDQEEVLRAPMVESGTWKLSTAKLWLPGLELVSAKPLPFAKWFSNLSSKCRWIVFWKVKTQASASATLPRDLPIQRSDVIQAASAGHQPAHRHHHAIPVCVD